MGRTAHITCSRRAPAFLCRLLWFRKSAMREHPGAPLLRSSNFCFCALICGDNSNLAACRKGAWRQNGDKKSNVLFCSHLTVDAGVSCRKSPPSAGAGRGATSRTPARSDRTGRLRADDGIACRCHEQGTAIVRESVRSGCARLASRAARTAACITSGKWRAKGRSGSNCLPVPSPSLIIPVVNAET